jgi:ATP-dependent protease ClpP protease subunit
MTKSEFNKLTFKQVLNKVKTLEKQLGLPALNNSDIKEYKAMSPDEIYSQVKSMIDKVEAEKIDKNKYKLKIDQDALKTAKTKITNKLLNLDAEDYYSAMDDYTDAIHDKWIDIPNREMWIHGVETSPDLSDDEPGIEHNMAAKVIKNLHFFRHLDPTAPVIIHMKSCGGIVEEGLAIYDAIKAMPYHVTIISYTHARSMTSYILQAADHRVMMPSSVFMFHYGDFWVGGTQKQTYTNVDWSKKHYDPVLMKIYTDRLRKQGKFEGQTRKQISTFLIDCMNKKEDYYLNAKDAVKWGFADEVHKGFKILDKKIQGKKK